MYQSFINKLSSLQPDFSTQHTARVKPSQYIAQHLYEQKRKSNCSSCSSQTSYIGGSKVFTVVCIFFTHILKVKNVFSKRFFSENSAFMYGYYSRAVCNQERVMMAGVLYHKYRCNFIKGLAPLWISIFDFLYDATRTAVMSCEIPTFNKTFYDRDHHSNTNCFLSVLKENEIQRQRLFLFLFLTEATHFCITAGSTLIQISAIEGVMPIPFSVSMGD